MDEPSKPMDQEEEGDEEYFSARENANSTPTPQRSDRESPLNSDASPSSRCSKKSDRQQHFFKDENAQQLSSEKSKKVQKSEKVRRLLKDRDRWDTREYKKEEPEPAPKQKKKKKKSKTKKKVTRVETEDASKTDEESDENDEPKEPIRVDSNTPQSRPFFQSTQWIMRSKIDVPALPKMRYNTLRFQKSREIVEYDADGEQHQLPKFNERAISNPWRRWGAHRALCSQGGFQVINKKIVKIERGADPPPRPKFRQQITLNKNTEIPDSQSLSGSLRVGDQDAEEEGHRIAKQIEDLVNNRGGFVPPAIVKKDMVVAKPKVAALAKPVVVVQPMAPAAPPNPQKDTSNVKVKKKKPKTPGQQKSANKKGGKRSSLSDESDSVTEEEKDASGARGGKKQDESKKGVISSFFNRRRKPTPAPTGGKPGSKESRTKNNNKVSNKQ